MKTKLLVYALIGLTIGSVITSCAQAPEASPSPEQVGTSQKLIAATPVLNTEAPSASPTKEEATAEPIQATETPPPAKPQPAAAPHFQPGAALSIDYIKMTDVSNGWGISGPYILTTKDGGNTWQEVTPPETLPQGTLAKAYAAFPDAQHAWVVFGIDQIGATDPAYANFLVAPTASVWSTSDGGRTWTASPPLNHEAIGDWTWAEFSPLNSKTGWMMMRGVYLGAGTHYNAQFLRTQDGITWQPIPGGDIGVDYTGMVFADENNGWLTWQTTGAYAAGPPEYAVTKDGGENWESRALPPPANAPDLFTQYDYCEPFQPNPLSAQSVRLLEACFDYFNPPKKYVSYLYSSDDAGQTWNILPLPAKVNGASSSLIYLDENNALLLGHDMYQSEDGGKTWSFIKSVVWDGQFSFVDKQNGWAVARNGKELALVQTNNGGLAWTQLKPVIIP